ncbi:LysR family transcriptional regulator [Bacillus nitroreducens]
MDIRQIEYFVEVAKHLNITKAASILHISQPSLSKVIRKLESDLGTPLFYRGAKQLDLTDVGKAFLVSAKNVLQAYENLTMEISDVIDLKKGEIKIGIPPIIGATFFSKLISSYKEAFPSIQINLTEVGSKKIKRGVAEGELDIGLVCNLPIQKEDFDMIKLVEDPLVLLVHKDHPLSQRESIELTHVSKEPFIMYRNDFSLYDKIMEACGKLDFYPNIVCESSQKDFMIEMVEAKLGVALLPSQICRQITSKNIIAIPFINPTINLELGMIWKKDRYMSHAVREFIAMVES